jgi:undecaprenyl-diphosphatase
MEARLLQAIHANASPFLDFAFRVSHLIGTVTFFSLLVLTMTLWHLRRGEAPLARLWFLTGLSTFLLQEIVKRLVARPRPELWPRLFEVTAFAFPSGHALASATLYPLLALDLTRGARQRLRVLALGLAALACAFIGMGRVYLGVHWPSDVLGGWLLGLLQLVAVVRALRLYERPVNDAPPHSGSGAGP